MGAFKMNLFKSKTLLIMKIIFLLNVPDTFLLAISHSDMRVL